MLLLAQKKDQPTFLPLEFQPISSTPDPFTTAAGAQCGPLSLFLDKLLICQYVLCSVSYLTTFQGKIRCNVHFFEGGNVQLKTDTDKTKRGVPAQNAQQLAQNIAGSIGALDADWQNQFENLFDNMGQTTYKALRRPLPMDCRIIGSRWGMIQSYKLGADLTK